MNLESKVEPFVITKCISYVAGARRFLSSFVEITDFRSLPLRGVNTPLDIYVKRFTNRHRQHHQRQKGEIKE